MYYAKVAFVALPATTQQQLKSKFEDALDKENKADLAFLNAVDGVVAAGSGDYSTAIGELTTAVSELLAIFNQPGPAARPGETVTSNATASSPDAEANLAKAHQNFESMSTASSTK